MPPGARGTPVTIQLDFNKYTETIVDSYPIYTFYVLGSSYLELPLDANVRLPSIKSIPYNDMMETLEKDPKSFLLQNGGINAIASKVAIDKKVKNRVHLTFPSNTGIVNGGHTQLAIINSKKERDISKAIVKLEVIEHNFNLDDLAEIAASKNTASNVKPYSIAEKRGLFLPIKKILMERDYEKHIIWFENREVPNGKGITADDLIALLNLFNIRLYQSNINDKENQPTKSATSKGSVYDDWLKDQTQDEKTFQYVYPLSNDIIELMEHIQTTFHEKIPAGFTRLHVIDENKPPKKSIFQGQEIKWNLPRQFLLPILASFRACIILSEDKRIISWYEDPKLVFDRVKGQLTEKLKTTYRSAYHSEINRASKDSNLWQNLYYAVDQAVEKESSWKSYNV